QLDADIARLRLGERVTVLGTVSTQQIAELYAKSDIFALASRFEGYGMAYSEAIAHGLPVVGTNAGAIPDIVPPNAGILVEPDDVPAFAVALRRLTSDANERKRLAAGARAAAAKLPTWQDSAKIVARTLEALT
ncbi:MAG TPA: glycosyltransferase family 4 protein, partial [Pseudolabrys sp.]|nr:glycosyltransferase family 4 protein [Pseudolabrys sp.]